MDTSETYIKMCEKAWPYLKPFEPLFSRRLRMLYIVDGQVGMWHEIVNTSNADRGFALWEQDRLQEMVEPTSLWNLNHRYSSWLYDIDDEGRCDFHINHNHLDFTSMEQLWLAFLMYEKYDKVWLKGDWIIEKVVAK